MFKQINKLYDVYKIIEKEQYNLNAKYHGKELKFDGGLKGFEDAIRFEFSRVSVAENMVEIDFWVIKDDKEVDCVEYISIEQFNNHFQLIQ